MIAGLGGQEPEARSRNQAPDQPSGVYASQ
jgi:hypothetical protein